MEKLLWKPKTYQVWIWKYYQTFYSTLFSHVTKNLISKNLNLKKKSRLQLSPHFPEKSFQAPKFIFRSPKLIEVVVIWAPFERRKIEVHIFERANHSGFGTWNFTTKEDLNWHKQVFLLNFRPCPAQKPKIWSIFNGN